MIDSNTLLQTDATIIAGVLILLTIYSLNPALGIIQLPQSKNREGKKRSFKIIKSRLLDRIIFATITIAAVFPFSSSAFYILSDEKNLLFATHLAEVGFLYVMVAVAAIVIIPFLTRSTTTEDEER